MKKQLSFKISRKHYKSVQKQSRRRNTIIPTNHRQPERRNNIHSSHRQSNLQSTSRHQYTVGINIIQWYANCTIATSGFVQINLNQKKIKHFNHLMTTRLSDINASFDKIHINVINHLDKLDIKQSHIQDNILHIVKGLKYFLVFSHQAF